MPIRPDSQPIRIPPAPEPRKVREEASAGTARSAPRSSAICFSATTTISGAPKAKELMATAARATIQEVRVSTLRTLCCMPRLAPLVPPAGWGRRAAAPGAVRARTSRAPFPGPAGPHLVSRSLRTSRERTRMRRLALAAALLCGTALAASQAQVFRWANDGDVNSMDPYARNETFLLAFNSNIYEPLVRRNRQMEPEPALAARWEQPSPDRLALPPARGRDASPTARPSPPTTWCSRAARARPGVEHQRRLRLGEGGAQGRRPDGRVRDHRARPDPDRGDHHLGHHVARLGGAEQRDAPRRPDHARGELRHPQRHGHRALPPGQPRARPPHRAGAQPDLVGHAGAQPRRASSSTSSPTTRRASRRCSRARWTWSTPCRRRTSTASRRTPGVRVIQGPELRTIYLGMDQSRGRTAEVRREGQATPSRTCACAAPSTRRSTTTRSSAPSCAASRARPA